MLYLFIGAAGQPASDVVHLLQRYAASDPHGLARACAIQGVVKATSRLSRDRAALAAAWVSEALAREGELAEGRVRLELESNARTAVEQDVLRQAVNVTSDQAIPLAPLLWPAESV